jgi:beta-N-acetylhexosaminidase
MIQKFIGSTLLSLLLFTASIGFAQDSLDIKIGQMILIGFSQSKVDEKVLGGIKNGKVGSVIFFERNIPAKNSYAELKKMTWTYQHAATIPLFIAIDQEGGRVNRLKEKYGFPRSITAAKMGKYALDSVQFYAETTAATLAGLGFNVNFAPVVDVASNPTNPIIAKVERSFSANPDSVALFADVFMKAHQRMGVVTVLKHFPGHGSSKDDTHLGIADVTNTWNENELIPYQKLIDSGRIDAMMTAHIVNKKLDDQALPGTLSNKITTGILRNSLRFNGVVFSDDMQMHAITKHYKLEESIKLAILAGVDILTFSNNIQGSQEYTIDKVHAIIRKLVENGTIPAARIDESYRRIMELKRQMTGSDVEYYRKKLAAAEMDAYKNMKEAQRNAELAQEAEKQALDKYNTLLEEQRTSKKKKKKTITK